MENAYIVYLGNYMFYYSFVSWANLPILSSYNWNYTKKNDTETLHFRLKIISFVPIMPVSHSGNWIFCTSASNRVQEINTERARLLLLTSSANTSVLHRGCESRLLPTKTSHPIIPKCCTFFCAPCATSRRMCGRECVNTNAGDEMHSAARASSHTHTHTNTHTCLN